MIANKEYIIFNERTGFEYMKTRSWTVASAFYNQMKEKHGEFIRMKIISL